MSNLGAVLNGKGERFTVTKREIPKLLPSYVLIKVHAIATNPVDWKVQETGFYVQHYPIILGSDVAGEIEAVSDEVTIFQKGDRVIGYAGSLKSGNPDEGAFQEYCLVHESLVTQIPESWSYEDASTLPMAVATTGSSLLKFLNLPQFPEKVSGGILIWGGSSSMGSIGLQMGKLLGMKVFTTASSRHHDLARRLGADFVVDYKDPTAAEDIIAAAKAEGVEIKYVYDAVVEGNSAEVAFKVLEAFGGGEYAGLLDSFEKFPVPKGVNAQRATAFKVRDDVAFGSWLFNDWLKAALEKKEIVPSLPVQIVDGGIESLQKAMDIHKAGVSGVKLVVPLK
ncbi:hypothetical protein MMC25_004324 [Agyrium rufum]|nr:hypothetical protein [Agyrium rufum]